MRPTGGIDRDIFVERAATLLRKTRDVDEVCKQLKIGRPALYKMALAYDIPWSIYAETSAQWPSSDAPGEPGKGSHAWKLANYRKAQKAAREALKAFPPPEPKIEEPPPPPRERDYLYVQRADEVPEVMRWQVIMAEVCQKHGITQQELVSSRRSQKLVAARNEASYRMYRETPMNMSAIARRLNRDHTTIIYSIRRYEEVHGRQS